MAALTALSLGAGLSYAEPPDGSLIDPYPGSVREIDRDDAVAARRAMNEFGRCFARNRARLAERMLSLPLMSPEQHRLVGRSFGGYDGCLAVSGARLQIRTILLIGPMAEWMIIRGYADADLGAIAGISDERLVELGLEPRTGFEDFGLCVVRRAPEEVRALVQTIPGSDEEEAALGAFRPHLGPCLPAGEAFSFNRSSMRALLAFGLYRALSVISSRPAASASD